MIRRLMSRLSRGLLHRRSVSAPVGSGWACVLWERPLIIATWFSIGFPLGALSVPGAFAGREVTAYLLPAWTLETDGRTDELASAVRGHMARNPAHRIIAVGSNPAEVAALRASGLEALQVNANGLLDDHVFRPLDHVTPRYDAVYNARLSPTKRHELARDVESLALVFFRNGFEHTPEQFHRVVADYKRQHPSARFVNPLTEDGCRYLTPNEVNQVYSECRVGLSLSAVEGACRTSMEYMLAGLPVVSTRSIGGRDYFFDPDYCLIVDDDPRAVRDGVDALVRRNIPRAHVRERTLARVDAERQDFARHVQNLVDEGGGEGDFSERLDRLLHRDGRGLFHWQPLATFVHDAP